MSLSHDLEHLGHKSHLDYNGRGLLVLAEVIEDADGCAHELLLASGEQYLVH